MNSILKLNLVVILVLSLLMSCTKSEPEGLWKDNIKLSQKEIEISGQNNSLLITTQGRWWWIGEIKLNENHIDYSEINTTQNSFIIETPEIKIERKNTTEIHINMSKNTTGSNRVLYISLQAGDYFDHIKITQLAS